MRDAAYAPQLGPPTMGDHEDEARLVVAYGSLPEAEQTVTKSGASPHNRETTRTEEP